MSGSSDPELLRRLVEYELSLTRESSETVEEFAWGLLIHNPEIDALWSGNYLEVRTTDLNAEALAELADQLLARRGIQHRFVVPADPAYADRLVPGFQQLGRWTVRRSVYMVLARQPDRKIGAASEVPRETIAAVRRAVAEEDPELSQDAIEQRYILDAQLDAAGNGRWFASPPDGTPGASSVLYERDGIGQVESVTTMPERRGEGLASAVVMAAAEASRERGHLLTFIVADGDDWPWKLYERLGFDRVGEVCDFLIKPRQLRGDRSP
jgi:ribosomal protein S18 acetylase RimI-like enzyme